MSKEKVYPRNKVIAVKVTAEEKSIIEAKAKEQGLPLASYLRKRGLE